MSSLYVPRFRKRWGDLHLLTSAHHTISRRIRVQMFNDDISSAQLVASWMLATF
jgi:hypothetical protein